TEGSAATVERRPSGRGGCGPQRVLRLDSARGTDEVSRSPRQRQSPLAPAQAVAGSSGRKTRQSGPAQANHSQQGLGTRNTARRSAVSLASEPLREAVRAGVEATRPRGPV